MKKFLIVTAGVLALAFGGPRAASATSFDLNVIDCGCLPVGSVAGTVNVTSVSADVADILVTLNTPTDLNLTFHDSGLDSFSFNGPVGLTSSDISIVNAGGSAWTFFTAATDNGNADGAGSFMYWFDCAQAPNSCTGLPSVFEFRITYTGIGSNLAWLETTNNGTVHPSNVDFAANVAVQGVTGCTGIVGAGNGTNQSTPSGGFTSSTACPGTPVTPVPEPASMLLLGTGLLVVGSRLRTRRSI